MKKILSVFLLIGMMMPVWVSCSSDDEEEVDLNSYIVGTWHSYKVTYNYEDYEGETITQEVTKTGDFSSAYYEMIFKQDGTMTLFYWRLNNSGTSSWEQAPGKYIIKGDIVSIYESFKEVTDFQFDSKSKDLCLQVRLSSSIKLNIYLKK